MARQMRRTRQGDCKVTILPNSVHGVLVFCSAFGLLSSATICNAADKEEGEAKAVAKQFLKSLVTKDEATIARMADVPWLAPDRRMIKEAGELKKHLEARLKDKDAVVPFLQPTTAFGYADGREDVKDETIRALFDQSLGRDGQIVLLVGNNVTTLRYLLVRGKGANAKVVGGPYKASYLLMPNELPKAAREALTSADSVELYSLSPDRPKEPIKDGFDGWRILGKTAITEKDAQKKLLASLQKSIDDMEGLGAFCFNPRHGLRIKSTDRTVDFVVCFECLQVEVNIGDGKDYHLRMNATAQSVFDKALLDAGVPLAPKSKK